MRIGVFSKFEMAGGSEFRCVELVNSLKGRPGVEGVLISEGRIDERIRQSLLSDVTVIEDVFRTNQASIFHHLDHLLVVNTDSKHFTTADYWQGRSGRHTAVIDLSQIKSIAFLFNFIVSPSCSLSQLARLGARIGIIAANKKFFDEISEQDRYSEVRHFPRIILESPIDPAKISPAKVASHVVRFGMHSKPLRNKWNEEFPLLIAELNNTHQDGVNWNLMGINEEVARSIQGIPNVTRRREFQIEVRDFLQQVDVFVFFPDWRREEAWSRSVAEALTAGCPVIATAKGGNRDQIIHGNNGFLCKSRAEFLSYCQLLADDAKLRGSLRCNAIMHAGRFQSHRIVESLLAFMSSEWCATS